MPSLKLQPANREDVGECIRRAIELPLREQSLCIWLAAEPVVSLWAEWCESNNVSDPSVEYIACYHRWRIGTISDAEFDAAAQGLRSALPEDLWRERNPIGGMAGWTLHDVSMIGLGQCDDVHYDVFATAIAYAAAAATGNKVVAVQINWSRISDAELDFVRSWWRRCQMSLPVLNRSENSKA